MYVSPSISGTASQETFLWIEVTQCKVLQKSKSTGYRSFPRRPIISIMNKSIMNIHRLAIVECSLYNQHLSLRTFYEWLIVLIACLGLLYCVLYFFFSYFFVLMGTRRPFKSQDNKCIYVQNIIYDSSVDPAELNVLVEKKISINNYAINTMGWAHTPVEDFHIAHIWIICSVIK